MVCKWSLYWSKVTAQGGTALPERHRSWVLANSEQEATLERQQLTCPQHLPPGWQLLALNPQQQQTNRSSRKGFCQGLMP